MKGNQSETEGISEENGREKVRRARNGCLLSSSFSSSPSPLSCALEGWNVTRFEEAVGRLDEAVVVAEEEEEEKVEEEEEDVVEQQEEEVEEMEEDGVRPINHGIIIESVISKAC